LVSAFLAPLKALAPQRAVTQYKLDIWQEERGFRYGLIFDILQARDNYIWLATLKGLVRFDGTRFSVFNKDNTAGLKENTIQVLHEGRDGRLWLGTSSGGLSFLKNGTVTTYGIEQYPALKRISTIFEGRDGILWIGTMESGLTRLKSGKFTTYTTGDGLPSNKVRALFEDEAGRLWIATSAGLSIREPTGTFSGYVGENGRFDSYLISMCNRKNGEIWFGGSNGLYRLKDKRFTHYGKAEGLPNLKIKCLYEDRDENLWAGTDGGGLVRVTDGTMETLSTEDGLACDFVYSICEDREGSLWFATLTGGLHRLRDTVITTYTTKEGLVHDRISCIFEDRDRGIWIGTGGHGVNRLKDGKVSMLLTTRQGLLSDTVYSITGDRAGNVWIGTQGGLNMFNGERLTGFSTRDGLSHNSIFSLLEDSKGVLWMDTRPIVNMLYKGKFSVFGPGAKVPLRAITCLFEDREGTLWFGTNAGGVHRFRDGIFTTFTTKDGLVHNDVECIYQGNDGVLYIGTRGGLSCRVNGKFSNYTTRDGLIDNDIRGILEDESGNLWFSSSSGIYSFNKKEFSGFFTGKTVKINPVTYDVSDGMKKSYCRSGIKARDGKLWFTSSKGVVMIDPRKIEKNTLPPPVAIEELIVDGESVKINRTGSPLIIPPGKKRVEFVYTALSFVKPRQVKFKLKLEGYDTEWVDVGPARTTTYTRLSPGDYTFSVTACNSDGIWNPEGASLSFYMKPYWYSTPWAYAAYILIFLAGMVSFIKWRSWKLVREKKRLEQTVKDRTKEIYEKTLLLEEQSEQLKELDGAKSRFFANISHEFRTPLTLIMGPLEQMLSRNPDKTMKAQFHVMLRNSKRLLNLVNQLLELARLDSGKMKLAASEQNIVPFLRSIVMCFESLADQNRVALMIQKDEEDILLYFDTEKLEKIISNLMSNAFKYTPADGRITVSVRKVMESGAFPSGCVEISVRDTGTGIPGDQLPHIFDRFFRVEGGHEHKQKGSGIGLSLTRELVLLHHGEIGVNSNCREGDTRGTEFIVRLPMGNEHLQPEEIAESGETGNTPTILPAVYPGHADEDEAEEEMETDEAGETAAEEKSIILVVDDNPDVRSYIKGALNSHFKVVEAADGKEGILRAKEILPDLIVSDVMMPDTDGYELCRTLKNDILTSHIPIILLTARVSKESVLEGLETGADDYITKPFSTHALTARIGNLIDLRRQLQLERKNRMALRPEEIAVTPVDDEFYMKLQETVESLLSDPDFNVEALSRALQMSQATLYRKIQALTGKTPTLFIRIYRLKRAAHLLGAGAGSVSHVAVKVGFSDPSYFAKCFKEQFNRSPSELLITANGTDTDSVRVDTAAPPPEAPGGEKEIVLVVEDNGDARDYIRQALEPDYRVVEAVDGGEGITRAMEIIPDLVISDVMMPRTDGYELCRVLKKDVRTSHIPIVMLTARASEESMIRGLETGADDYITKPFNADILRVRIKNLIRLRSHLQKKRDREMTMLPAKISESDMDREFMDELNAVIEKNLSDPDFNVEQLAKKLYMSSATLYRKIQALTGEVPSEYIRSYRLRRAARLFKNNFGSVTEVAFEVGFNSRTYFTRCFKEKFHQLPTVFKASESG